MGNALCYGSPRNFCYNKNQYRVLQSRFSPIPRQQERRMTMKQSTVSMRIRIENLCIGIIFLFSLMLFALSFFHRSSAEAAVLVSTEMGWMVQRAVSVLLFCLVSQLKKRKRAAYDITLLLLLLSLLRGIRQLTPASVLISVIDLLLLAAFLCFRRDFCCPAAPKDRKRGLLCPSAERARRDWPMRRSATII